MAKQPPRRILFAFLAILLLAACKSSQPQPLEIPAITLTALPTDTIAASTATLAPSATPVIPPTPTPTVTLTPWPQDLGPQGFPAGVNPLTGLTVSNPALLERRPLAVKIQIFPRSQRPPMGLSQADIVYDYYQNDGLTRFHAIFYGNDAARVGPIRSARLLDDILIRAYHSVFAFGGADHRIYARLINAPYANRLIVEGSSTCPPMCRQDPNGANILVASTQEMQKWAAAVGVDNARPNLDGMSFQYQPPAGGQPGTQAFVRYSISAYVRWDYDLASGAYLRFQDAAEDNGQGEAFDPLLDRETNAQIAADNVVVLFVPHADFLGNGTYNIVDILLSGSGPALAFRDGQAYENLNWVRSDAGVLFLTDAVGNPFPFKQGNTWFQVVGQFSQITKRNDGGVWRIELRIP
ncbi:MAG: DUF3048 domain-containing protein [Chloroflexi bacterium]|nr:DUF3048 domain-containing protein [Chloroflexota bacterium]